MRLIKAMVVSALPLAMSACVAVPYESGYSGGDDYYGSGYGPGYYQAPAVVAPSVGFGYYDGDRGWEHGRAEHERREHERHEHEEHEHGER